MSSLFEYYRLITNDEDGNVCYKFQLVKPEDITICNYPIERIIKILRGLDLERISNIEMTMDNLKLYYELINKEHTKYQEELIKHMVDDILKGSDKE